MRPSHLCPRDRGNYKESAACPKTKASNCSHFHIPLFFVLFFPSHAVSENFSLFDTFSFRPRDRANYKESAACPITKASNNSHFHFPLMFLSSTFTTFSTFYIQRRVTIPKGQQQGSNMLSPLIKVKPCCAGLVLGWVTEYEYPVL